MTSKRQKKTQYLDPEWPVGLAIHDILDNPYRVGKSKHIAQKNEET